jgi:hypothetical protein
MVDGKGPFAQVHRLRDDKRADVVVLIVDDPSGRGLSTRVAAEADEAYAVVHRTCAAVTYSIAHEIGHIIGARHDIGLEPSASPFPYGHGYVNGTKWRDIMSYRQSCNGCPRISLRVLTLLFAMLFKWFPTRRWLGPMYGLERSPRRCSSTSVRPQSPGTLAPLLNRRR